MTFYGTIESGGAARFQAGRRRATRRELHAQQGRLEALNLRLADVARTDELTGLGNRLRLREDLAVHHDRLLRYGDGLGLVMLDIDHFKTYNDHTGTSTGTRRCAWLPRPSAPGSVHRTRSIATAARSFASSSPARISTGRGRRRNGSA